MKKLLALLLCWVSLASAQVIQQHQISDDGYVRVPLQFGFPFYGRVFTESFMFSNGVVGFLNPTNSWCCNGFDLRNSTGSPFSYAILGLQTDLINTHPSGRFITEGTTTYQKYRWENIAEFGTNNLNTFNIEIRPTGYININHEQINLQYHSATIGVTGDTTIGEYTQFFTGMNPVVGNYTLEATGNMCLVNPLSSPSCSGYQEAYTAQQCSLNPLYSPSCVGYQEAYFAQQCSIDPLYDRNCSGYQQAYYNQQCSLNPLYDRGCQGYATAYFNQQCSISPLYDRTCPGYEAAYFNQQCSLNPLYNTGCQGYAQAYFNYQCTQNPLYDATCPGYAQAYFNQQCTANALYDRTCPGYSEAYALANIVKPQPVTVAAPVLQVSTTGTVAIETPIVKDPIVNEIITKPAATTAVSVATKAVEPVQTKVEEKKETKTEVKQSVKKESVKAETSNASPTVVDRPPTQQVQILDLMYTRMLSKPIQDNAKGYYFLIKNSQHKHEEMVNEQYRR